MSVGKRVEARRLELKMSQKHLGNRVGLTQPTLSSLENGKSETSGHIARLAKELQVHAFWLETGEGPKLLSEQVQTSPSLTKEQREILSLLEFLTSDQVTTLKEQLLKQKNANEEMLKALAPLRNKFKTQAA